MSDKKSPNRFHGRVGDGRALCAHAGCHEPGEFRAPDLYGAASGFDGPGSYRWLCFNHVREFNSSYNFFKGMSREEIEESQTPFAGWATETRAFTNGGVDSPPKWRDFHDPLDAISARFRARQDARMPKERADGRRLSEGDRKALDVLKLDIDADRRTLRQRYTALVRQYHPDHNGGDRAHEKALQSVVEAYQRLRTSAAFK
ncbi:MAG: J domain-containing protein [Pseudomonadota bacterium]